MSDDDIVQRFIDELEKLNPLIQDMQYRIATLEAMNARAIRLIAARDLDLAIELLERTLETVPKTLPNLGIGVSPFYDALDQLLVELRLKRGG